MTNAIVNNTAVNPVLFTTGKTNMLSYGTDQNVSTVNDFQSILQKENRKQTINDNNVSQQKDTKDLTKQDDSFEKTTEFDDSKEIENAQDGMTAEGEAGNGNMVQTSDDAFADDAFADTESMLDDKNEAPVDEKTFELITETLVALFQETAEVLGISEDELLTLMQENGIGEMDLFYPDTMTRLALAAQGEDSVIGIVMNETIYENLQELMTKADDKITQLTQQLELPEEDVKTVLEQLKGLEIEEQPQQDYTFSEQDEILVMVEQDTEVEVKQDRQADLPEKILETDKQEFSELEVKPEKPQQNHTDEHSMEKGQQQNLFQTLQDNLQKLQQVQENTGVTTESASTPENILKQIADFVKVQTREEVTQMEFQLHPASLGTVNIQLATKGGVVTAQLTAENETVKHAIETQIADLRSNLEEQGIKVEAIEVTVSSHQMEKNLEKDSKDRQEKENSNKMEGIKKTRRASINLNDWLNENEMEQGMSDEELEATNLTREMMAINGGTMDVLA